MRPESVHVNRSASAVHNTTGRRSASRHSGAMLFPMTIHASPYSLLETLCARPFSTAQATAVGIDRHELAHLVANRVLRRVLTGVYVRSALPDTVEVRLQAASLILGPFVVACDRTASWMLGVDTFQYRELEILPPLELRTLPGHNRVRRAGCSGGVRDLDAMDIVEVAGVKMTKPARTALDLACKLGRRDSLAALDGFMRGHGLTHAELQSKLAAQYVRRRGVVQARELVALADPLAESPGESWTRLELIDHGLPTPRLQHWVQVDGRPTFRLDMAYPKHKIAIEYDGREFHEGEERRRNDQVRRRWLLDHGWIVIVVTKDDFASDALDGWIDDVRVALRLAARA